MRASFLLTTVTTFLKSFNYFSLVVEMMEDEAFNEVGEGMSEGAAGVRGKVEESYLRMTDTSLQQPSL